MTQSPVPITYLPEVDIRKTLEKIASTDLRNAEFEELRTTLMEISRGLFVEAPIFDPGIALYRARNCYSRPDHVRELSHPPPSAVHDFGRANRPNQSVFYLNTQRNAVFFEMHPVAGDLLAVGHWETIDKLMMFPVGYSDYVFRKKGSERTTPAFGKGKDFQFSHPINVLLQNFFAAEFTKKVPKGEPWRFKLSAAIAEDKFSLREVDGILYPTVAMRANSDNFALKPSSDRKLVLKKVEFIRIDEVKDRTFEVTVLDTATDFPNGKISWKGKPKWTLKHSGEMLKVVNEAGQWRAYDMNGNVREYD